MGARPPRRDRRVRSGAEAHLTGELAVCAGSCGPGNLHLINGLFDCHRSRVPVLAIAAQIPSAEIGSGYFQETHPQTLFKECSHYCELISGANQMPHALEVAIREAVGRRGVAVLVMPGDVALQAASNASPVKVEGLLPTAPVVTPARQNVDRLAALLNGAGRVTICAARDVRARMTSFWHWATASRRRWCTRCAARNMSSGRTPTTSA